MAWERLHNESIVNSGFEYFTASFRVPMAHNIFTGILLEEMAFDMNTGMVFRDERVNLEFSFGLYFNRKYGE